MTAWRASGEGREGAKVGGWRFCSRHSQEVSGTVSASRVCGTDGMPSQCLGTDRTGGGAGPVLHICLSLQLSMWKRGLGWGGNSRTWWGSKETWCADRLCAVQGVGKCSAI